MKLGAGEKLVKLLGDGTPSSKKHTAASIQNLAENFDNMVTQSRLS